MFIERVISQFTKHNIPYALVGGHAMALHGVLRGTVDVDLIIKWSLKNLKSVELALSEIGLKPHLPIKAEDLFKYREEYIKNRNLIAWNFINTHTPSEIVDIIITWNLKNNMIKQVHLKNKKINILSKKHLISMKRSSLREQDLIDAKALEQLDET